MIGTNKRTGSLKARKLKQAHETHAKTVQGIISSLKESFGFIERADVVAEIFFHYSEFDGEVNDLMIGDDVEFQLQNRSVSLFSLVNFSDLFFACQKWARL